MNARQFVRLIRVPTLAATAVPLIIGGSIGLNQGQFSTPLWLDIFVVALLIQIATNMFNEYGDYRRKIDTAPSSGFAGLLVSGETSAREILLAAIVCYSIAFFLGFLLVIFRGIILLFLGVVSLLVGILYSEGPIPISSTPFGEIVVAVIMGPVEIVAANIAVSAEVSPLSLIFSVPVGFMVAAILLANNLRDLEKDRDHGRRTFAVLVGMRHGSGVLLMLMVLSFLWTIAAFLIFSMSASIFLVWLAFPIALWSYFRITRRNGWPGAVATVSRLHLLIGALLAISIIIMHF